MSAMIFSNATLVLPDEVIRGTLSIRDGLIEAIDSGATALPGAVDLGGDYLMPGLIELHTDNLERHIQPRPGVDWPHAAAIIAHDKELAGTGITTVFDAMRVGSVVSDERTNYGKYARGLASELLEMRASDALRISHFLHLRAEICSETLIEELDEFGAEDRVGIVSLMDHTPGARQFRDVSKLKDYVVGKFGLSDAEFQEHVDGLKALGEKLGPAHEAAAVAAAKRFGATLASHDDTTAEQVAASAAHGARIGEFPTTEEAARAAHQHGIVNVMGAPNLIRGGSHSGNVAAAHLAQEGLLDIISSDYVPSSLLSAAVSLGDKWNDMAKGIATVTKTPAHAVGLDDRGALEVGLRADLIRVARVDRTPVIRETWVRGQRVS